MTSDGKITKCEEDCAERVIRDLQDLGGFGLWGCDTADVTTEEEELLRSKWHDERPPFDQGFEHSESDDGNPFDLSIPF